MTDISAFINTYFVILAQKDHQKKPDQTTTCTRTIISSSKPQIVFIVSTL